VTGTSTEIGPELVAGARGGDPEALRTLVTRAYPVVRRWALVRTGDPSEADDLTQDVLVRVIQRLDAYHGASRFTTWLYTVTRNAAADRFRREARRRRVEADPRAPAELLADAPPRPDEVADRATLGAVVRAFFQELPHRQREVFDLSELQGLTSVEIGERLGIEPVSVRAHLFKARRALRARIVELHPELAEDAR
jgi:RNA polymerase sigma-70 factor (ECF subfamily)